MSPEKMTEMSQRKKSTGCHCRADTCKWTHQHDRGNGAREAENFFTVEWTKALRRIYSVYIAQHTNLNLWICFERFIR